MLCDRLPRHVEALAQFGQRLSAAFVQTVNQYPTARISEDFEHFVNLLHGPSQRFPGVLVRHDRQVNTCMSRAKLQTTDLTLLHSDARIGPCEQIQHEPEFNHDNVRGSQYYKIKIEQQRGASGARATDLRAAFERGIRRCIPLASPGIRTVHMVGLPRRQFS